MFKIGDFAKLNKVTISTLRHYDAADLLKPVRIDDFTGYRYYSANQMPRLNRILALKDMGFSLEEIRCTLEKRMSDISFLLEVKEKEVEEKIKEEQARLTKLRVFMDYCKQEDVNMEYDIIIKKVEPLKVAGVRDFIPNYSEQGHLWEELAGYIGKSNAKIVPPCMVIYYNVPEGEERVDCEVIEPVQGLIESNDRIKIKTLAGEEQMACVVHMGSYRKLNLAYTAVLKWIEENEYSITGPHRELYLMGEWDCKNEEDYVTEVQFPVSK
jgi:effector-binding domain-containing protein